MSVPTVSVVAGLHCQRWSHKAKNGW